MPPKVAQKSKAQKLLAAMGSSKAKGKKKKWAKQKVRDKKNNDVLFDPESYQKMLTQIPKMKTITIANVSERLHITGSLARRAIRECHKRGDIAQVVQHQACMVYTKTKVEA